MFIRHLTVIVLFTFLTGATASATATTTEEHPKTKGITLFNQYKDAEKYLRIAATEGDAESQYYLAETLRKHSQYITPEAAKWYIASAKQGNFLAMIRLGRSGNDLCNIMNNCSNSKSDLSDWLRKAQALALPKAQLGDAGAMYIMYEISNDRGWLKKSADAGYPLAQYWMGITVKQGEDVYFIPGARRQAVERWFELSAKGGYPKAMIEYAVMVYENQGNLDTVRHWIKSSAETGYEGGITSYGAYLAHDPDRFGFPLDLVKGYGLISLLKELDGGGNIQSYVNDILPEIAEKMTPEQIEKGKAFASQWRATHPPLSFFPDHLEE